MKKRFKLEPFDIERAKAGEPVCTRNGEDIRIICFDRNNYFYPIVALRGHNDEIVVYSCGGKYNTMVENFGLDLMMKVEVKEPVIYAEVAGEIRSFEEVKAEGFIDLKSFDYLIIKTYDGKFLKIWKKDLLIQEWEEAQKKASEIGEGWRCPTRHECIDIYDARFKGLNDAMKEIGGESIEEEYWTSEADLDPQYYADFAVCFNGNSGNLSTYNKYNQNLVRPVCLINNI